MFVMTENPTTKTLIKWPLSSIGFWGFSFSTAQFACRVFFGLYSIAASSLVGLYDNVLVSAVSPFSRKKGRKSSVICFSVEFFHVGLRVSLFVHEPHPRGGAPRLFRNCASARILRNILLFWVFSILQSFHSFDLFEYSSVLTGECQGRTWWIDSWFVALLASWPPL